jgi:hypothetical protein
MSYDPFNLSNSYIFKCLDMIVGKPIDTLYDSVFGRILFIILLPLLMAFILCGIILAFIELTITGFIKIFISVYRFIRYG